MKKLLCIVIVLASIAAVSCGTIVRETAEFRRGTVENNVYESKLAGIRFSPGPAWKFNTEESFLNVNGIDPSLAGDEKAIDEALNKLTTVFDMTAEDEHSGLSVAVAFENLSLYVGGESMTEEEYIEKLKSELGKTFADYTAKIENDKNAAIAHHDCKTVKVTMQIGDREVDQYYYVKKLGSFIMSVSVTASSDSDVEKDILSYFESIKNEQ